MYQPFPIYDFKSGLKLDKEPWLLPATAFHRLEDAYIYQGVINKRRGFQLWAEVPTGLPIMGIWDYWNTAGTYETVVFDTRRMYRYDEGDRDLVEITSGDTFTGDDSNFFFTQNYKDRMWIVNGVDPLYVYDGSSLSTVNVDIDSDGYNDLTSALLIFQYKERLILLRTTEHGTLYPQRLRWCVAGEPTDWTNDGYFDLPTQDWITGAELLHNELIVWCERSIWVIRYTGDSDMPFKAEKVVDTEGCSAPYSISVFADEMLAIGPTSIISCDGLTAHSISEDIPDITLDWNPDMVQNCYAVTLDEIRQNWWSYPSVGKQYMDKILALNYADNTWSIFNISMVTFGYFYQTWTPTFDNFDPDNPDITLDEIDYTFDERTLQAGYPTTLGGDRYGRIFTLNRGNKDYAGTSEETGISMWLETARWNPFLKEGHLARLGWVDFLVDADTQATVYIDFYSDEALEPYQTVLMDFKGDTEKVWKRVYAGAMGKFHRLVLRHESSANTIRIHAIIPYFQKGGRIIG